MTSDNEDADDHLFNILIEFNVLRQIMQTMGSCQLCSTKEISVDLLHEEHQGFCNKISISCSKCDWSVIFYTSSTSTSPNKDMRGKKSVDMNKRAVIAFREIGQGHEGINKFTTMMNMPPSLCKASFNDINNNLHEVYTEVSRESMAKAAKEVRVMVKPDAIDTDIIDCQIGIDGSWQKRGYSSFKWYSSCSC